MHRRMMTSMWPGMLFTGFPEQLNSGSRKSRNLARLARNMVELPTICPHNHQDTVERREKK